MNKHYHITMGMEGGYLPDVNYVSSTKHAASDIAMDMVQQFRDDWDIKYSITGNKNNGYYIIEKNAPDYRLGTLININLCYESDCMNDLD